MNYIVRSGDTLSKIARDVVGNMAMWPQIASVNNLVAPYTIYPGQVLQLPEIGVARTVAAPAPARLPSPGELAPFPKDGGGTDLIALAKKYWWVGALIVVLLPVALAPPRKRKA